MLQKIKFAIIVLVFLVIVFVTNSCCKKTPCKDFTADELSWVPYTDGEIITFKSTPPDSILKMLAFKDNQTQHQVTNCNEGAEYCTTEVDWHFQINGMNIAETDGFYLQNTNYKKTYGFRIYFNGNGIYGTNVSTNLISIVINGISYTNVLMLSEYNFDTIYCSKGVGFIALHKTSTKQWFYKT